MITNKSLFPIDVMNIDYIKIVPEVTILADGLLETLNKWFRLEFPSNDDFLYFAIACPNSKELRATLSWEVGIRNVIAG